MYLILKLFIALNNCREVFCGSVDHIVCRIYIIVHFTARNRNLCIHLLGTLNVGNTSEGCASTVGAGSLLGNVLYIFVNICK